MKKCNSKHQFGSLEDARKFVEAIRNVGFRQVDYDKDGGIIYANADGYKLHVCVKQNL